MITSLVGLAFVLNAKWPLRFQLTLGITFMSSWLTSELAPQLLALHVVVVVAFAVAGAVVGWMGWTALGISALIGALLVGLVRESYRVEHAIDEALTEAIGPGAERAAVRWKEYWLPFKLSSRKIKRMKDVPYAEPGGRRLRLDIWSSAAPGEGRPCMLYIPGGAWLALVTNKNHQGKPLLLEMAARGWVCFSINYPVSPRARFPEHIVAVKRAIAWIREHAHEYGGDERFLMVSGNSAGGHLSALAALTPNDATFQPGFEDADTTVQAAAPFYGVYDWTGSMIDQLSGAARRQKRGMIRVLERVIVRSRLNKDRDAFQRASPIFRINPDAPPFFVIHGSRDILALVEEARAFVKRLREVSQEPVAYAELPGAQHAFDHFLSIRALYAVRSIARFGEWAFLRFSGAPRESASDRDARSPTSPS